MSFCKRAVLALALVSIGALMGCGNGTAKVVAPPSGGFDKTNFSGTYVFSITGGDVNFGFLAIAGVVTADGNGNITSGTLDINDSNFSGPVIANPITGGSYTVSVDGRGQAVLTTNTPFGSNIVVDFVLTSGSHGLITQFDNNGTGSGTLDLQSNVSQAQLAGTYVFSLTGTSGFNQVQGVNVPAATVGYLTIDGSGNATGGMDYNNNGSSTNIDIVEGSNVLVGSPGTALIQANASSLSFDVYPISANHLKVIEADGGFPILTGDMYVQTSTSFPAGNLAFTMAGLDYTASPALPQALGGIISTDGANITGGVEDYDDAGVAGTVNSGIGGTSTFECCRYIVTLNGFVNGNGAVPGTSSFAAYPSSGGVQMIEVDNGGITAGVAYAQSNTAIAASQGYGFNLSAANANGFEEDDIAEFTTTSSSFSGAIDYNDVQGGGSLSAKQSLTGTYTPDSPATGRGVISANAFNGAYYTVDGSTTLFLEADQNQLGLGTIQLQSTPTSSALTRNHFAVLKLKSAAKKQTWKPSNAFKRLTNR